MARQKGQTNRVKRDSAFKEAKNHLKYLTFTELEEIIAYALRYKKEKLGSEELRLIKEKEEIEQKLEELKTLDKKMN